MQRFPKADEGTRTPDPLLTMEVLYQLSYVGAGTTLSVALRAYFGRLPLPLPPPPEVEPLSPPESLPSAGRHSGLSKSVQP
jgi:hypothetical protein